MLGDDRADEWDLFRCKVTRKNYVFITGFMQIFI